jgi:hypothetical protein
VNIKLKLAVKELEGILVIVMVVILPFKLTLKIFPSDKSNVSWPVDIVGEV